MLIYAHLCQVQGAGAGGRKVTVHKEERETCELVPGGVRVKDENHGLLGGRSKKKDKANPLSPPSTQ